MRDAAGEASERFHLLRLAQLLFEAACSCSACLRALMSTIELRTNMPSSVSIGLRPISTGTSVPSFLKAEQFAARRPSRAFADPGRRQRGIRDAPTNRSGTRISIHFPEELVSRVAEQPFYLAVDQDDLAVTVDHQQPAGRGFDRRSQPLLDRASGFAAM